MWGWKSIERSVETSAGLDSARALVLQLGAFYKKELKMKVRDILKLLGDDGWKVVRTRGSHRQVKHPEKKDTVTVAGKSSLEIPVGTLKSIFVTSQLEGKEEK